MILTVDVEHKSIGNTLLFADMQLSVAAGEKLAIIGRNGVGKTSLFRMLTGEDTDFAGVVSWRHGAVVVATAQEHHDVGDMPVVTYILQSLPEYARLKHIIDTSPETMGDDMKRIERYSEALERFGVLDYYTVEDRIRQSLEDYQLADTADRPMRSLSGGQKRFVELVRVEHSAADLALVDEPTNHMDTVAKQAFLDWFKATRHAVVVITHDRDLLGVVDRIIEIKDNQAFSFPGNYTAYLSQNAQRTAADLNEYDTVQRRITNVKKQIQYARSKKSSWGGTADKKNPFVVMEERLLKELKELESQERPSFWIDKESAANLKQSAMESYAKHKARTIRIRRLAATERQRDLLTLDNVQAGYTTDKPLFQPIHAQIQTGDRIRITGRNGVGKSTLVRTILAAAAGEQRPATLLHGGIKCDSKLRINTYEQEINPELLDLTLGEAIERMHDDFDRPCPPEQIMRLLADYLFDPYADRAHPVRTLSGGQKARLQLMRLFLNEPNLIILDEPTNHLDLPSIEELEAVLTQYTGALLYISHDSYVAQHLGGETLEILPI